MSAAPSEHPENATDWTSAVRAHTHIVYITTSEPFSNWFRSVADILSRGIVQVSTYYGNRKWVLRLRVVLQQQQAFEHHI